MRTLSINEIRQAAPSVFAEQPSATRSENYRFYPTSKVLEGLLINGFQPVYAGQSRTRIAGNENYVRHVMRFRHSDLVVSERSEIPEIVIMNSHNGTSAYKIMLGFFRMVCSNGLIVCSGKMDEINIRHSGKPAIVDEVLEGSYEIIKSAPRAAEQIEQWKNTRLEYNQQIAFAEAATELRPSTLEVSPTELLSIRREADIGNDLWKTYNRVQENIIKGGVNGKNVLTHKTRATKEIKSVDANVRLNRALWTLAEKMAGYTQPQQMVA
jgi:hypothetical protein